MTLGLSVHSYQDSVKARQFETELAHIKDEFERLRLAYESTKEHINAMEARLKPDAGDQTEKVILRMTMMTMKSLKLMIKVKRLTKETAELRTELAGLKAGLSTGKGESGAEKWGEAGQVFFLFSKLACQVFFLFSKLAGQIFFLFSKLAGQVVFLFSKLAGQVFCLFEN